MNKKYIAIILATMTLITVFTACSKDYEDERIIKDREDNIHILATDKEGNTMQNEDGNIIEVVTDAKGKEVTDDNGNQVTQAVTYPDILEANGFVEDQYVKIKPEEGWTQTGSLMITMNYEKYGAQYVLDVSENKDEKEITDGYKQMADQMKKVPAYKEASFKSEKVKLGGIEMTKITIEYSIDKKYVSEEDPESQILYMYVHSKDGKTYNFQGSILPEYKDKVDFDKIIASVIYK